MALSSHVMVAPQSLGIRLATISHGTQPEGWSWRHQRSHDSSPCLRDVGCCCTKSHSGGNDADRRKVHRRGKRSGRGFSANSLSNTRCGAIGDLRNEPHFELDVQQFFVIEGSCRSRPALEELDVQQFFVIEGSCRSRPAIEELDGQQFFAIEPPRSSKWKSRAQVAESCLKVRRVDCVTNAPVPKGTTALSTPPFVRAGYDCRNNTTVLSRPEAVGWAPLVCAGLLTTSLRGLWVSGLLPPGNGGQC